MNFITPFLLPYMAIFSSPVFAIFTMLSFWQAWQGVQLGRGLWAERHKVWQEPLTAEKMRRLDSAAFLLAIPPTVFIHELGHAIAVWVFGGRVLEFGFFFFWGYILPDRQFEPVQEWIISSAGTWGSLLCAAVWGLLWFQTQSSVLRYFARRAVRLQIFFALIYYPLFTLALTFGDWRTIYDFSLAPTLATITAVVHATILAAHLWAESHGLYEQTIFNSPSSAVAFARLAERAAESPTDLRLQDEYISELWRRGANHQAQARIRVLLRQHPQWADGHLTAALIASSLGRRRHTAADHAQKALQYGLSEASHLAIAHRLLGSHFLNRERYDEARQHFEQALTALQTFLPAERTAHNLSVAADLHYSMGLTYLRQRQNAPARAAFEQALTAAQQAAVPQQIETIRQHLAQVGGAGEQGGN